MADGTKIAATQLQPSNIEAEQALLGALLLNNDIFDRIDPIVQAHHFYEPVHGRIFDIASRRIAKNALASPVTLKPFLADDEGLKELGGTDYLARLAGATISIVAARDYAETIRDLALRRDLVEIGEEIIARAATFDTEAEPAEQITEAEAALYTLAERGNREGGFIDFAKAATDAANMVNAAFQRGGGLAGISSGLAELDYKLGGFRNSDLIIIAGRPSMGKTALATNIAFNIARKFKHGTKPDGVKGAVAGASSAFSRWKCHPSSSRTGFSPPNRRSRATNSSPAASRRRSSAASSKWRVSWNGSRFTSTTPPRCRFPPWRPGPGASSAKRGWTCW